MKKKGFTLIGEIRCQGNKETMKAEILGGEFSRGIFLFNTIAIEYDWDQRR